MRNVSKPVRSSDRFLVFGQPCIEETDIREVVDCLESRWIGTGPKVFRFEQDVARYKSAKHALAVSSATAGMHLACIALGLKPGDEVITTALTFCSTINVIIHAGATPVLADVDINTMNVDPDDIERRITERTRGILPVHLAGRPCDMDRLSSIAARHNLFMVEDCAHAIETSWHGRAAGTFGEAGVLSFYATKNLATGEGGMVLTNDDVLADRVKQLRLHGLSADAWARYSDAGYKHYYVVEPGFKYNMMDLQAAIGIHQLERLERYAERRRRIWEAYMQAFARLPIGLPAPEDPGTRHARHLFTIRIDPGRCGVTRDEFLELMTAHNIGVGVHFLAIPQHPYYQQALGWRAEEWPRASRIGSETVSLPLSGCLTDDDVADVIAAVTDILS